MLSLLGFPGTLGFIGKWYILLAVLSPQGKTALAVMLVLTSVVSAGYYLPVDHGDVHAAAPRPAGPPRHGCSAGPRGWS